MCVISFFSAELKILIDQKCTCIVITGDAWGANLVHQLPKLNIHYKISIPLKCEKIYETVNSSLGFKHSLYMNY